MKKRLDVLLVERGLAESRSQAQALVLAGLVRGYEKPGRAGRGRRRARGRRGRRASSRAEARSSQNALDALDVDVAGRDCVDVGASTGGFTDCLLQAGAARVVAIDVGYGQLHPRLRSDPRVTVLERVNARALTGAPVRARSRRLRRLVHQRRRRRCRRCSRSRAPGWEALVLVKPQFEAGRSEVAKGVVRDPDVQRNVLESVIEAARAWGGATVGVVDSGLPGPKGNREFFVHLEHRPGEPNPDDIDRWIADAVG